MLDYEESILESVRSQVVGTKDNKEFDDELIPFINSSIGELNQNGIGKLLIVNSSTQTWEDLESSEQKGNDFFKMVPLFIALNTKILFDPPPPSNVEHYASKVKELLWRLKIAYELGE